MDKKTFRKTLIIKIQLNMIAVVITIIGIVLYRIHKEHKENITRIKELERRLDEYYKEREQRAEDKELMVRI